MGAVRVLVLCLVSLTFCARRARDLLKPELLTSVREVQPRSSEAWATMRSVCGWRGNLAWRTSRSGNSCTPCCLVEDLSSLPWRRVVVDMHVRPLPMNAHVFLIGKRTEQFKLEHEMSRQCIECLAEILA